MRIKLLEYVMIFLYLCFIIVVVLPMELVFFLLLLIMSFPDRDSEVMKDFCNIVWDIFELPFKMFEDNK